MFLLPVALDHKNQVKTTLCLLFKKGDKAATGLEQHKKQTMCEVNKRNNFVT